MTDLLYDAAWNPPVPLAASRAGYKGALRYLSTDPAKNLSLPERDALRANNMAIGLVWETTASRSASGFQAGVVDAQQANAQADVLGYPADSVIFYATDFDANADQVRPYYQGARSVSGRPVGGYGSIHVVDPLLADGTITKGWQTCAWSGNVVSSHAHLYQRLQPTLPNPGGSIDENVVLRPDWGGWMPNTAPPSPTPQSVPPPVLPPPPPPQLVNMFIDPELGVMKQTLINCNVVAGSGWMETQIPFGTVISVMKQGSAPQRDNTYWTGEVSVNDTDNNLELTFTECKIGVPGGEQVETGVVGVYVVTAG